MIGYIRQNPVSVCIFVIALVLTAVSLYIVHFVPGRERFTEIALGGSNALVLDASRRAVFQAKDGRICAEPSPDVIGSLSAALESAVNLAPPAGGQGEAGGSGSELGGVLALMSDEDMQGLFQRSQGVQALRDGMYRLCEAYMNDAIDMYAYEGGMQDLVTALNFIVPLELCANMATSVLGIARPEQDADTKGVQEASKQEQGKSPEVTNTSGLIRIFEGCMALAATAGEMNAGNARFRSQALLLVRGDTQRFAFETLFRAYSGAEAIKEYCSQERRLIPSALRNACQSIGSPIQDPPPAESATK